MHAPKQLGYELMQNPLWNKGTAFSNEERDRLGLRGLVPAQQSTIQQQVANFMQLLNERDDPLSQNLMLQELHNRNETLFHRVLVDQVVPRFRAQSAGTVLREWTSVGSFQPARPHVAR